MGRDARKSLDLYLRLLAHARPHRRQIVGYFLLCLLGTPLALLLPVPLKIIFDSVLGDQPLPWFLAWLPEGAGGPEGGVLLAVGILLLVTLLVQLQGFAKGVLRTYTGERMVLGFRAMLFRHAQRLSLAYHDAKGTADSIYRIQYDASAIEHVAIDGIMSFVTSATTLVAMIGVTAWLNLKLALVALAVAPFLFHTTRLHGKRLRREWREVKNLESSALKVVQESLGAVRVVKAFGREDHHGEHLERRSNLGLSAKIKVVLSQGWLTVSIGMTTACGTAAVLFFGVRDVQAGVLTTGNLLVVMSYLAQLYGPLKSLGKKAATVQRSLASAERAFTLLDEAPEVSEAKHPKPLARAAGAIQFQGVSFRYGDHGTHAVRDVSLEVAPGTRVGIAGHTGAGKTTLMNLLCRFYDPQDGRVLVDGVDIREYRLVDLRDQFSIVLQEPVLFSNSIFDNIAYARPDASREEVEAAARAAGAHEFILALPDGYETLVGERGMRLSGGERQRVSLARAFLKDARILILDEPTSSVDIKTEAEIMAAMERLMEGRTTFMIAHRLSTLEHCDQVVVLEKGRVLSMGPAKAQVRFLDKVVSSEAEAKGRQTGA